MSSVEPLAQLGPTSEPDLAVDKATASAFVVRRYQSVDSLPPQFGPLFERAEAHSFDLSLDWFRHLCATALKADESVQLFTAESQASGESLAVMGFRQEAGTRQLRALATFYSSLYAPICRDRDAAGAVRAIFEHLAHQSVPSVRLQPLEFGSENYTLLRDAIEAADWSVFEFFCTGNWFVPTAGLNYEDYAKRLPSQLRNTIKRKRNRLLRSAGRVEVVTGGDGLEAAIAAYDKVYRASWKVPEPFPEFMPGLIRLCSARGWLRLGLVHVGDEPAAAQMWIVNAGRASIYKLAYDAKFAEFSAGSVLSDHLTQHVLEVDRVREIDYLTGDDAFKQDWMTDRRERWGIVAYNRRSLAGLTGAAAEYARRLVKKIRPQRKAVD
jgi:CelD/BcsL family acetyltransferase involved in cellulose biosynthesis